MDTEDDGKIYSLSGECLYEVPFTVNLTDSNESVGDMIDLSEDFADREETIHDIANEIKIEVNIDTNDNKIYSVSGDCLFEGPYSVIESIETTSENLHFEALLNSNERATDLLDFEALIDASQNTKEKLQEFENVLNTYQTSAEINCDFDDVLDLEEINDLFVNVVTDGNCLNTGALATEQNNESKVIPTEVILEIDSNCINRNIKLETQSNEAANIITREDINLEDTNLHEEETHSINSDGYHSSDFEFITENEAVMDGYIINISTVDCSFQKDDNAHDVMESSEDDNYPISIFRNSANLYRYRQSNMPPNSDASDPGEGPSGLEGIFEDYRDRSYREDHQIPDDEGYLDLFQGPNILPLANILRLENKSTRSSAMNSEYEGIGFDLRLMPNEPDSSEEEYADEARESLDKIMFMYPYENRKPRRRF